MEKNYFGYYPLWEGLLDDIRLVFGLESMTESMTDRSASTKVAGLEVDWIELTGVEELLQGELPRPPVFDVGFAGSGVFAPQAFYPIVPNLGVIRSFGDSQEGVLTDLDGDGDLDLFSFWFSGGRNHSAGSWRATMVQRLLKQYASSRWRI